MTASEYQTVADRFALSSAWQAKQLIRRHVIVAVVRDGKVAGWKFADPPRRGGRG